MLNGLTLKNFRNHTDTEISGLRALNVIVGPNGVGKSSVLEAAYWLHQLGTNPLPRELGSSLRKGIEVLPADELSATAWGTTTEGPWTVELSYGLQDEGSWEGVRVTYGDEPSHDATYTGDGLSNIPEWLRVALRAAVRFRFEPSALRRSSYPERLPPRIDFDGYGLASVVSYLMRTAPEVHKVLSEQLTSIVPSVVGLRTNPVKVLRSHRRTLRVDEKEVPFDTTDEVVGDELLFDTVDGMGIRGADQSDGTLFVLGVLTALSSPPRPKLVLLDDIETGIHPGAQRKLVRLLRQLTEQISDLQIIMTSHSPYVLDELTPEEVWVAGRGRDQLVRVKRLADHPKAEEASRMLTTGEFWSIEGEDWAAESAK